MAFFSKTIAATQFLSNMLLMYFFVNCSVQCMSVSQLLLNIQVSNGHFIATFTENVKSHKYLENHNR